MLQGAGLDMLLGQLDAAVNAKNYAALESAMDQRFSLGLYRSERAESRRPKCASACN